MSRYPNPIQSYEQAEAVFKTCRSPVKGKPLSNWCRMYKEGSNYAIKLTGYQQQTLAALCYITRGNKLVFTVSPEQIRIHASTIVGNVSRVVPMRLHRIRKGVYRIGSQAEFFESHREGWAGAWKWLKNEAPQYYPGIKFDLTTGKCVNAKPDLEELVIPDMRKAWRRDLRRYKRGLYARAKLGILSRYAEEMPRRAVTPWQNPDQIKVLIRCMKADKYPTETLKNFSRPMRWRLRWGGLTAQDMMDNIDAVFRQHSLVFRKAYGVFGNTKRAKS